MKKLITIFLLIPFFLNAETFEFCYRKYNGGIWNTNEIAPASSSIIPYRHTRRLGQGCIRIENTPASWTSVVLTDYKINLSILASATIILPKNHVATTTVFYQGSDGKQINFNSVDFQAGIIEPK